MKNNIADLGIVYNQAELAANLSKPKPGGSNSNNQNTKIKAAEKAKIKIKAINHNIF
jgi:hypothetical protein